ncbi:MAG: hypothetical protein ACK4PM_15340 [Acinetobacter junii]
MNEAEKERLKEAFRSAKGIVDHEFSQEIIDASAESVKAEGVQNSVSVNLTRF